MFKISVEGETLEELAGNLCRIAAMYQRESSYKADDAAREELQAKRNTKKAQPEPEPEDTGLTGDDALDAPAQPMPETATQVVDGGTGKPVAPIVKMTAEDVKVAAAKLAAKDATQLASILKTYGAAKLSEVPKDKLAEFASDVMEALG